MPVPSSGPPATHLAPQPPEDRWSAWDSFLQTTPHAGFMQSSWWADFRATTGYQHFAPILKDHGRIVGGALVLRHSYSPESCFYYVPEGPALPSDEAIAGEVFERILDAIETHRKADRQTVSHLRIEPRWEYLPSFVSGFEKPAFKDNYTEPRNTLCIDLRPAKDAILAQMKPKGRYNIRVAQRHGVSVTEDTSREGIADFLRIYKDMAGRQGIRAKPASYFHTLISLLVGLRRGSVFFAEYKGVRLAAAVVVYFGPRATYFFGGSLQEHRQVMAPYLLHFEIMRRAKAFGHEWYDLWGVAPENRRDHSWWDISVFKRKFGGVEVRLVPTLDHVYDATAYADYAARKG